MFVHKGEQRQRGRPDEPWEEGVVPIAGWKEHWTREDLEALHRYLDAHDLLPERPEELPEAELARHARVLADASSDRAQKELALILLAHHRSTRAFQWLKRYLAAPDPALERFARFAYQEALEWLRLFALVDRNEPCPCGSSRPFKRCCGERVS
jgi:hypothetical protein